MNSKNKAAISLTTGRGDRRKGQRGFRWSRSAHAEAGRPTMMLSGQGGRTPCRGGRRGGHRV